MNTICRLLILSVTVLLGTIAVLFVYAATRNHPAAQGGILLVLILSCYMLPTVIAVQRRHHNTAAIGVLNFFLGWTFAGWIAALVWSATAVRE